MNTERPANTDLDPSARADDGRGLIEAALVTLGLVSFVGLRSFQPFWEVGRGLLVLGVLSGVAYLVGREARRRAGRGGLGHALLVTLVVSQPVLLSLWALDVTASRIVLAGELTALFIAIALAGSRPGPLRLAAAAAFACVAVTPTFAGVLRGGSVPTTADGAATQYLFTSYHDLSLTTYEVFPQETQDGGALAPLPDGRVLLVAGSGAARVLQISDAGLVVDSPSIDLGLPLDVDIYRQATPYEPQFYRVFDVLYDAGSLFASHIHWDQVQDCYTLRLAEATFDGSSVGPWTVRFESQPCVPLTFMYNTSGGRLAVLDDARLLMSVGTFGIEEVAAENADFEGWREHSDYGKLLVLDRSTWEHSVYSAGHRNPQGLLVTEDQIWSTEHGPHGGDELNLIEEGSDYGWPYVSFGTAYGRKTLASGNVPGDHSGFTMPVYTWIPSIGVSNLIRVEGSLFASWRGDLLVGSLSGLGNGYAFFRVRVREGRAVSVERIPVSKRVRDLVQLPGGGPLVLWSTDGTVTTVRPADHVFSSCAVCHGVRNAQHGIGPDLYGVVGAQVARHENYDYSEAMRSFGGDWTPERLDRFLTNPGAEVPGTSMEHEGVADPTDREELIQFLDELSGGRPLR